MQVGHSEAKAVKAAKMSDFEGKAVNAAKLCIFLIIWLQNLHYRIVVMYISFSVLLKNVLA